ncbi:unnamed protein product, partial [Adineta ricciae]
PINNKSWIANDLWISKKKSISPYPVKDVGWQPHLFGSDKGKTNE